jgi:hypothetical protein
MALSYPLLYPWKTGRKNKELRGKCWSQAMFSLGQNLAILLSCCNIFREQEVA